VFPNSCSEAILPQFPPRTVFPWDFLINVPTCYEVVYFHESYQLKSMNVSGYLMGAGCHQKSSPHGDVSLICFCLRLGLPFGFFPSKVFTNSFRYGAVRHCVYASDIQIHIIFIFVMPFFHDFFK
jgi:hypothetical protein